MIYPKKLLKSKNSSRKKCVVSQAKTAQTKNIFGQYLSTKQVIFKKYVKKVNSLKSETINKRHFWSISFNKKSVNLQKIFLKKMLKKIYKNPTNSGLQQAQNLLNLLYLSRKSKNKFVNQPHLIKIEGLSTTFVFLKF